MENGEALTPLQQRLVAYVKALKPGTTICPGMLTKRCGSNLKEARAELIELAQLGLITLSQKGHPIRDLTAPIRGPFRVGPKAEDA